MPLYSSFLNYRIAPDRVFVNAPGCQTRREAQDFWLRNNRDAFTEPCSVLKDDETVLDTQHLPFSNDTIIERQIVVQKDQNVRKSIRIGKSFVAHEVSMAQIIRSRTSVPIPRTINYFKSAEFEHLVMERMPGEQLKTVWCGLSSEGRDRIAEQVLGYVRQFRQMQSPVINVVQIYRKPVLHEMKTCLEFSAQRLGHYINIAEVANFVEKRCAMVEDEPKVFSHSDLSDRNILVENGNVTAIIDFESSGYCPAYWEWLCAKRWARYYPPEDWMHRLERELAAMKQPGWDGMWEVELLVEAIRSYDHWRLTPEDRRESMESGRSEVMNILGVTDIELPTPQYPEGSTHPFYEDYIGQSNS